MGILANIGVFTKDAQLEARGQEKRRLTLADLRTLFDLYDQLDQESKNLMPLRPVYFLAPGE